MLAATRLYEATVEVRDPIDACADLDAYVEAATRAAFAGRCRDGAYIIDVVRVVRRSDCRIPLTNTSGRGVVDVRFLAAVAVLGAWDIVTGVRVQVADALVVGKRAYAFPAADGPREVILSFAFRGATAAALASGQRVPARVVFKYFPPHGREPTALACLLTCETRAPVYRLRGRLEAEDRAALAPLGDAIEAELARRAALDGAAAARLARFERLLYAYRAPAPAPAPPAGAWPPPLAPREAGVEDLGILEAAGLRPGGPEALDGLWSRPLRMYPSEPRVARAPAAAPPPGWEEARPARPAAAFALLLKHALDWLTAVRELAEDFADEAEYARHESVWAAMRAQQLPAPAP